MAMEAEMAALADELNAKFAANHTKGVGEGDPHANYRVNPYSYLSIDGEYEYSITMEPKEIPQGFHITQHEKLPGLRKFKVVKDGVDKYDIVYVGTMMVQNGFAYISGQTLFIEEPYDYLTRVRFPPFAVSYPLERPAGITSKDFEAQVMEQHRGKLIKSIEANENDTSKGGIFDFDLTKDHVLYPPHPICTTCQAELLLDYESTICPVCDDPERGQVDHETVEQVKAVQEMKAEIKKMEARLNEKETANKALELQIEAIKSELREALMKVGCMTEEVEKSNRKAARVAEQLQAVQADHAAELRELRALIASVGRLTSAYADLDDDILKKRRRMSEDADKV